MKDQSPKSFSAVSLTVLILVALLLFSSSSPLLASSVFQNFLAQLRILGAKNESSNVFIDHANGNVGIGKTDPDTKLDVEGTITATKFKNADGEELGGSVWTTVVDSKNIYREEGNVGIGETNPAIKLEVKSTASEILRLTSTGDSGYASFYKEGINTPRGSIGFGKGNTFWNEDEITNSIGIRAEEALQMGIGPAVKMTIANNGNVGIGKTDPATELDVEGTITATKFIADGEELGGSFWTVDGNNIYREEGNVGIGTDNPGNKLQIAATANDWPLKIRDDEKGVSLGFSRNSIRQRGATFNIEANEGDIVFKTNPTPGKSVSNLTERMKIARGTGNVGIGTDNPSTELEVKGTITATKFIADGEELRGSVWTENPDTNKKITYLTKTGHKLGIGTENPTSRLTVDGNITLIGASGSRNIQIASGGNHLNIRNPNVDKDINLDISPTRGKLLIRSHNGTSVVNNLLTVQADGKVGIGVETPGYKLDVNGDINTSGRYLVNGEEISLLKNIILVEESTCKLKHSPLRNAPALTLVASCPTSHPNLLNCTGTPGIAVNAFGWDIIPDYSNNKCTLVVQYPYCHRNWNQATSSQKVRAACFK